MTAVPGAGLWCSDAGAGPPVLVVHGGGTHGPVWAGDLAELTATHRVIVPTRRGYPGSPPSPRDWSAHADDMVGVLDAADVPAASVVAHSAGCIAALDLALRHADRVERLVLLDPGVRLRSFLTPAFVWTFGKAQTLRRVRGAERAIEGWFEYVTSYLSGGSAWERMDEARRDTLRANADGVFADFASGDGSAQAGDERLSRLSLPVTVVLAGQSPASLRKSGEHLAAVIPQAKRIIIEQAGHALAFDAPDRLLAVLREELPAA